MGGGIAADASAARLAHKAVLAVQQQIVPATRGRAFAVRRPPERATG